MKKNSFLKNVFVLLVSQILIKVIGIVYKLYLINKTGYGDTGNALFSAAFQVYAVFLTICSIGIPNAISTLVSTKFAIGDNNGAYRVLKISLAIFGTMGFIGSFFLYSFSKIIAKVYLEMPETELVLKVLAPSVFLVAISAVLKGYFNGKGKMDITAKSLSIEQLAKTVITIILVEVLSNISNKNTVIMVCGVGLTTSIGSIINCFYLYKNYLKNKREIWTDIITSKIYKKESRISIIKNIFKVAFPITICGLIASLNKTIDAFTIVKIAKQYLGEAEAVKQYGILTGKVESLIVMPFSINIAIVTTLIPTIAGYRAKGELEKAKKIIKFAILIGILISIPCFLVLYMFPEQILQVLFPNASSGWQMLKLSSFSIIFAITIQTINSYLQGMNKMKIQIIAVGLSSCIKLALNIILISNENIGIYGAIISNIITYIITIGILMWYLIYKEKIKFDLYKMLIKPIMLLACMYIIMKEIYKKGFINSQIIKLMLSIGVGGIVYALVIFLFKMVTKKEIQLIIEKK